MPDTDLEQFDAEIFIEQLIEEMRLQNEDEGELKKLKTNMFEVLSRELLQAASQSIEPEVIDVVMEALKDERDPGVILRELVQTSPGAQLAMLAAAEEFRKQTLEAYNHNESK